ncbi:type VI secretion system Vgr family protein [Sorangium sp. So ce388]|uniref:type VI secretion system Vgr family protein n=1 Tax=Sorangium sp. So ce388 TaxID=3133309 RepID=UPI003F5B7E32
MARDATPLFEILLVADGLDAGAGRVRSLAGREGLSAPYAFDVLLDLPGLLVEPRAWLRGPAQVIVTQAEDGAVLRRYTGVVTRVREHVSRVAKQRLEIRLESSLAALRLSTDRRIFQGQTTQQIVSTLLDEAGVDPARVAWRLSSTVTPRESCTQFDESTFDFVSRLLEEDGIFYFSEHGEEGPLLVFGDAPSAYAATSPASEIPFRAAGGLVAREAITRLAASERARPAKVTLRDHDFKRPMLDLEASAKTEACFGREHYDHPGRYTDPGVGRRRAQARLDAFASASSGVRGEGAVFSLAAGHTFVLCDAPDPALERAWVVRDIEHAWHEDESGAVRCSSRFHLLPADQPYRPPVQAPRVVVPGPQVAVVTGPPGQDIHCDEHGRVKVRFPWDRRGSWDDKSSAWVRVGQPHTSGSIAIPRVGWEVMVDFEGGDPDRPVILGRLYNGKYGPPYALPRDKTASALQSSSSPGGGGHNEIRMEDGAGGEHVHVHAQKDLVVNVGNDRTEKVTTSASHGVGSSQKRTVGGNETLTVGAQHELNVGASQTWSVGASRNKTVGGDEKITVDGSRSLSIGGSSTTITPMSVSESTPASFSELVAGNVVEVAALDVGVMAAGATSVSVGGAKIDAVAAGKSDFTLGAHATTVGGALISATGADVSVNVGGAKATTVGGAWAANAAGDIVLSSGAGLNITVGGAVSLNAAKIVLKVGGSSVTLAGGTVVLQSTDIKMTATGPQPELAPVVADK